MVLILGFPMFRSMVCSIEGVGEVLIEHSKRARRLSLSVMPGRVRVAVPRGVALERGRDFAVSRKDWIRHHCGRMKSIMEARSASTKDLPPIADQYAAMRKILDRLEVLSTRHNMPYARAIVRNQKTRWGSCSMQKTISLNINLARLPGHLMDYVIVHELLHTRIRGHGPDFWYSLDSLLGDARALRKELRGYSF